MITSGPVLSTLASSLALATYGSSSLQKEGARSSIIKLGQGESALPVGEYDLEVLEGVATVYGLVLRPESGAHRIYAPSTHALPKVTARRRGTTIRLSHVILSLSGLEKLSPLFRNIWIKDAPGKPTFTLIQHMDDDDLKRNLSALEVEKDMEANIARLGTEAESTAKLTRIMAVGAKSSGKSTFNRILCNSLLSKPPGGKLMYLDLDPGQPEFGAPGQISLVQVDAPVLGPPFTHPAGRHSKRYKILRSHAIAATSFKDDPAHYVACAKDLVQYAKRECPLVVNSCGWVSGLGASVLQDLVLALGINHVVILAPLEATFVAELESVCSDAAFYRIARQPPRPSSRTPAELRTMQTMAYFHHRQSKGGSEIRWTSKAISSWRPWTVPYGENDPGISAILSYGQSPAPDFLAEVLEGSLVALVGIDQHSDEEALDLSGYSSNGGAAIKELGDALQPTPEGLPYLYSDRVAASRAIDPRHSTCVGLALVRAIDSTGRTLQLVTPLSDRDVVSLAKGKVVLVRGGFDTPGWAFLEDLHGGHEIDGEEERPWVTRREPVGVEGAVWRLRHPPMAADVR